MNAESPKRSYRQSARAEAAQATAERILDAFTTALRTSWFEEVRLDDVAREAEVTVQTVIRRFGSKEGLLEAMQLRFGEEVSSRRAVAAGDADGSVRGLIEDYEAAGDVMMHFLAQEDRYPAIRALCDQGRAMHREWITTAFAPWLEQMAEDRRRRAADALVVAGDLYVWKLLRRDMQRPVSEYRDLLERLLANAVDQPPQKIFTSYTRGDDR